jgi:hypothetical protein
MAIARARRLKAVEDECAKLEAPAESALDTC